jgi:hypothetical protein
VNRTDDPGDSPAPTSTPPPAGNADHVAAARALLARTAELPATRRELMNILSEYRAALFTFAISGAQRSGDRA